MDRARCANSDDPPPLPKNVQLVPRDFELSDWEWDSSVITYNFKSYATSGLTEAQQEAIFERAAAVRHYCILNTS